MNDDPKVLTLKMDGVPVMDASGLVAEVFSSDRNHPIGSDSLGPLRSATSGRFQQCPPLKWKFRTYCRAGIYHLLEDKKSLTNNMLLCFLFDGIALDYRNQLPIKELSGRLMTMALIQSRA